jgi:hypothetical protein
MMKFKTNNMNNLIFVLFITSMILFSCRRKKESIGPDIAIASSNFKLAGNSFKFQFPTSNFAGSGDNWFNASFNERVSWQIKIKGTKSKAYKIITGTSKVLDQSTALWTGTQSGIYFFIKGEKAVAELSVYGSSEKWFSDTTTINSLKNNYGPNALIWWDMDAAGLGLQKGWYDYNNPAFYDYVAHTWQGSNPAVLNDPVQGPYRSIEVKSLTPNTFWSGGFGANDFPGTTVYPSTKYGFPGASPNEVYLNFYIRRRNPTTPSMGINVKSITGKTPVIVYNPLTHKNDTTWAYIYTTVSYTVNFPIVESSSVSNAGMPNDGYVNAGGGNTTGGGEGWNSVPGTSVGPDSQLVVSLPPYPNLVNNGVPEGWSLVSVRLDQMTPSWDATYLDSQKLPFDPSKIVSVTGSTATADFSGYDMDFIVFTRGVPFMQLMDQIK